MLQLKRCKRGVWFSLLSDFKQVTMLDNAIVYDAKRIILQQ